MDNKPNWSFLGGLGSIPEKTEENTFVRSLSLFANELKLSAAVNYEFLC